MPSQPPPSPPPSPSVTAIAAAVAVLAGEQLPQGLGNSLGPDVRALASAVAQLHIELARRMDAWRCDDPAARTTAACTDAGLGSNQAALWRRAAGFARQHPALEPLWRARTITFAQVAAVERITRRLTGTVREGVVAALAPVLPGLSQPDTEAAAEAAVDIASPTEPDTRERTDYEHRSLRWTGVAGGIDFRGYLPRLEAEALIAAVNAVAEQQRTADDRFTLAQRRADALTGIVAIAAQQGLPTGGGLPAAVTLTISADEAQRLAAGNPAGTDGGGTSASTATGAPVGDGAARFALCCAPVTPIHHHGHPQPGSLLHRIALGPVQPLSVGRTVRLATTAQRKALQLRDGGCTVPGCDIPAAYTQPHHVIAWSLGGATDLDNLTSLCWAHHRQVEIGLWIVERTEPGSPQRFRIIRSRQ